MSFLSNMAVGLVLVSCYYMIMGTVTEEGKSEGTLSILNVFFSGGFMLSPIICGFIIEKISWHAVFIVIAILFVIFIIFLLMLNVSELMENWSKEKQKKKKESFLSLPLVLTTIAFFLLVYVEQIMNYFNQPYMQLDLKFPIELVGTIVTVYALSQMAGRAVFGKFLLPKIKVYKYIITSGLLFTLSMFVFLHLASVVSVMIVITCLGLTDSCLYPSILGYGLDQIGRVSPAATAFMVTVGSIGIPAGTAGSGLIGEHFGRTTAMYLGPIFLVIIVILILIIHRITTKRATTI